MNQTMEIYMARKKRVPSHYNPNSYRIFDNDVSDASLGDSKMNKAHIERKKEPAPSHPREPDRRNCPHPWHSRFLRHNIRLLNEPVCTMATTVTDSEQNKWWPTESVEYQLKVPHQSDDTTQRIDFVNHKSYTGNSRHSSNPLIIPTKGILPVTTSKTKADAGDVLLEKISYAHNYNCRLDPSEPRRGKVKMLLCVYLK
ncbi:unnamed protein product [Clavelina lepadiformis]|uniref:Uncharacterized protein n=1 Tax=Clavelina lepadiformis TaxID=159417 RepID=A0ABP0F9U3_CLALP